ncbi:hypothetical protein CAPGI0001_1436 [Capnocytophaga gingivalis ATCC 33624]|nr:hypothetical protein CAPGI0001_1436 [Capnocytophaga gingivalis ATCC 33624]
MLFKCLVFNWLGFRKCDFSQHFPNNLKKVHSLKDIFLQE